MKKAGITLLLLLIYTSYFVSAQEGKGSLVIVGGGLNPDNKEVYNKMIELAGGPEKAAFAVIPSASGVPVQSWVSISKTLQSYGVRADNIHLINISVMDDDSTMDADESKWAGNGNDKRLAKTIRGCTGVWFTGGDQMRTMMALTSTDGERTPVLDAVWEVYNKGGVIGGSSAGAAIMSEIMIGNGTSMGALQQGIIRDNGPENEETDALLLSRGIGFFPEGIVDQHFNQRARIGRLIVALMNSREKYHLAFGVDENTALIYSASDRKIQVAGAAGMTIINAAEATFSQVQGLPEITNLSVSYLENGDSYLVNTGELIPATGKKATRGNEYYKREHPVQSGILSANGSTLRDVITLNLIDNKGTDSISNLNFTDHENGFLLTFTKKPASQGYYIENAREEDEYSVSDIRMDISPVKVTMTKIK
ncbi:MAG: cyanophycinase [Bacteroidales bacterium]|nr:cyanophycinase [Bacteroidales bacterium]MBK9355852.1 cyanophycinase [Bacteroidales bacterium]